MASTSFSFKKAPLLEEIINTEWLLTNGIGGYASSTISGLNTRKYHGLLIAAENPPSERYVLLSKLEEIIEVNQIQIPFNTNQYPGSIHPDGYKKLKSFTLDAFPTTVFEHDQEQLKKEICMHQGHNTVVIKYTNTGKNDFILKLRPHFLNRGHHHLQETVENGFWMENKDQCSVVANRFSDTKLYFSYSEGKFVNDPIDYFDVQYIKEIERGQTHSEDTSTLGYLEIPLKKKKSCFLIFSTEEKETQLNPKDIFTSEKKHLKNLIPKGIENEFTQDLIRAYDQFKVYRKSTDSFSIIAGYPWFTDWGRDSMIALRGATLALADYEAFKSIFRTFFKYIDKGILPNRFPDEHAEPEYNTVDATLWSFTVLYEYFLKTKDLTFVKEVLPQLQDIIDWHFKGTHFDIHVNNLGFIEAGNSKTQLTWMDAKVGDHVETPRNGCPVEIQGLWYNALTITSEFLKAFKNEVPEKYTKTIKRIKKNFKPYFWNKDGYLNDIIIPEKSTDCSIRPNQVFVLTLPFNLLSQQESKQVLKTVEKHLLTPYGLRTLSPENPFFRANYQGGQWERDTAYHQGTVWPFLLGDYFTAYLKAHKHSEKAKNTVISQMQELKKHFYQNECVNGISEVFDGLTPTQGKGCINQAWSVSGILGVILNNQLEI